MLDIDLVRRRAHATRSRTPSPMTRSSIARARPFCAPALPADRGRRRRASPTPCSTAFPRVQRGQGHRSQAARADRRDLQRCRRDAVARPPQRQAMTEALVALGGNVGDVRATSRPRHQPALRRHGGAAAGPLLRLPHAALGRERPAALHQSLHRGRHRPDRRMRCWRARRRSSASSAATAPTNSAGARAPPIST